jgi:hypothetical protein
VAGPDGIIAADDVVVIKINYQWPERGGTNTDLLRGLIRCIVDHPDSFTGEVVVCENTQGESSEGFDRPNNNAQDYGLSPLDVVLGFQSQGYTVSHYIWTDVRHRGVSEYIAGNFSDGYVVGPYNAQVQGRVSYPKFQTDAGTYISLRYGIWDMGSGTYNREGLKFINVPVLKSHHANYGATACVKNYMGVVTNLLSTNSHAGIEYGILGALNGEIQLADLTILDCIWINPNPYSGPWTPYGTARRKDRLVASLDPVAADIWAVTNILIPGFIDNGYSPPWPNPSADPDDPDSHFRVYLDNSMSQILAAGYEVTNDLDQIDVFSMSWRLEAPLPEDSLGAACSEDDECDNAAMCIEGVCYVPQSRYLSVCASPDNAAYPTARRVSVEVGTSTIQMGWLDAPTLDPLSGIRTSRVTDYPVYAHADFPGEWPEILHVTGCKIVPGWTYWVQNILLGQSTASQSNYSDPLVVPTTAIWGDVVGQCPGNDCTPPQGDPYTQPDIDDVLALVSAFIGIDNAPLTWLDVDPVVDFGHPDGLISIGDVLAVVKAFVGEPYPGSDPFSCP